MFTNSLEYMGLSGRMRLQADEFRTFLADPDRVLRYPSEEIMNAITGAGINERLADANEDSLKQRFAGLIQTFSHNILMHGLYHTACNSKSDILTSTQGGVTVTTERKEGGIVTAFHNQPATPNDKRYISFVCNEIDPEDMDIYCYLGKFSELESMVGNVAARFADANDISSIMQPVNMVDLESQRDGVSRPKIAAAGGAVLDFKPRQR